MSIVAPIGSLLLWITRKSDVEKRMLDLSSRQQRLAAMQMNVVTSYSRAAGSASGGDISTMLSGMSLADSPYMQMLNLMSAQLERELKGLETEHNELTQSIESVQKLVDTNVKKEFKLFGGGGS